MGMVSDNPPLAGHVPGDLSGVAVSRRVRVTIISPTGSEYHEDIKVADDFDLPPFSDDADWITIEGEDGSVWAMPPRRLIGIVLEPSPTKPKKRGGRIN